MDYSTDSDQSHILQLVRIRHGSHLYGTSTPLSDLDIKGVHLPTGPAIVLQRAENVIEANVVAKAGTKNTPDAVDDQSYSLQKFLGMLAKGDTVATEILFADASAIVSEHPAWAEIRDGAKRFVVNRECKGFVGYCVRQAAKYGIKGSRMSAVKALIDMMAAWTPTLKLMHFQWNLHQFADANEHAEWVNIPSPNGSDLWHIRCCDRAMPMTATVKEALSVYTKVWENYGERARAAMTNEGIDWKAMSHAVRVARQATELLASGTITFPRPDADELLAIKQGKIPYSEVSVLLEGLVAGVHAAAETSALRTHSDHAWIDATVLRHYLGQLAPLSRLNSEGAVS